jgi:hypothetical protein
MIKKSVISLISYDAEMLPNSIKSYYDYVDEIILGLDKDRITWNHQSFKFDENKLWAELKKLDTKNKISIIEESFHPSGLAIENDNYERNFLKSHCTHDWIMSFDADEQLINPKEFFYNWCPLFEPYYKNYDINFTWFLPWKEFEKDILFITNEDGSFIKSEKQGFATHKDARYTYARWTDNQFRIDSPLCILHWSLCRNEKDLHQKINNIGHADKVKEDPFFGIWKQTNLDNYNNLRNFKTSGLGDPRQWPKLTKFDKNDLKQICKAEADRTY